jgi:hypothetical protein
LRTELRRVGVLPVQFPVTASEHQTEFLDWCFIGAVSAMSP